MSRSNLLLWPILVIACVPRLDPEGAQQDETTGQVTDTDEPSSSTSSGSSTSSSTSEDGDPTTSQGFVPDNDLSSYDHCDPFQQDCPPGEKCVPFASYGGNWDANKCVPVLGDGKVDEPCTYDGAAAGTDSCDATSMCWNLAEVDGQQIGTCTPFCTGSADDPMCPAGSSCAISCDGSLTVCRKNCDPIAQDCMGLGCYWAGSSFECIFQTQDIGLGEPCGFVNDCAPGLVCLDATVMPDCQGSACCAEFCDLNLAEPICSLPGTECFPWYDVPPPEWAHVGVCYVPGA